MPDNALLPSSKLSSPLSAALLTISGVAAAFGLASCCALPLLLAGVGIGTAWLGGVGLMTAPHRVGLIIISAVLLTGGAVLLLHQKRVVTACGHGGDCAPPALRVLTLAGLIIGAGLLWAGYTYA
jgi:mercuric ion transport protein